MHKKEMKQPNSFVDLISDITEFEKQNRSLLDSSKLPLNQSMDQFLDYWRTLGIHFSKDTVANGAVEKLNSLSDSVDRYRCTFNLFQNSMLSLRLTYYARQSLAERPNSPIALYNTKVVTQNTDDFNGFRYYDSIMYLLNSILPNQTRLTMYVRQYHSRQLLEEAAIQKIKPEVMKTPLAQIFTKAGWEYESYTFMGWDRPEMKRHRLVMHTKSPD